MPTPDYAPLRALVGNKLRLDDPLGRYTAARLGGPADALVVVESAKELEAVARLTWEQGWRTRLLGGGANVLISDRGYRGLVIVNHAKAMTFYPNGQVQAESGTVMTHIARNAIVNGYKGFNWAVSVPGTIGGGVVNNAGAHGGDMASSFLSAQIAFAGSPTATWDAPRMAFQYRGTTLKHNPAQLAVLTVTLQLETGHDPAELQAEADEFIAHRKRTQPPGASLGSMFKNPPNDYAGRLIELAGLKGTKRGGVIISPVHGNFFVNLGRGTASDYLALIELARVTVLKQFDVALELEVELVGEGFEQ